MRPFQVLWTFSSCCVSSTGRYETAKRVYIGTHYVDLNSPFLGGGSEGGPPSLIVILLGEAGSPVHAWLFFVGFLVFPLWWVAGFLLPIPRKVGESEVEKGARVYR